MGSGQKDGSTNPFSAAATKLVLIVFKHCRNTLDVDWDVVAKDYGYKDGTVAKQKFYKAKSEVRSSSNNQKANSQVTNSNNDQNGENDAAKSTNEKTKPSPNNPRKRKAASDQDGTVPKRPRGRPPRLAKKLQADSKKAAAEEAKGKKASNKLVEEKKVLKPEADDEDSDETQKAVTLN